MYENKQHDRFDKAKGLICVNERCLYCVGMTRRELNNRNIRLTVLESIACCFDGTGII